MDHDHPAAPALRVDALRKAFPLPRPLGAVLRAPWRREFKVVLDGCALELERGEKVALIGPNGAGKTTLSRIVCGTALRDDGEVLIDGLEAGTLAARAKVALARPDDPALHPRLTLREALRFHLRLYGVRDPAAVGAAGGEGALIAALGLGTLLARRCATLSAGERAKASLCKALLCRPSLLILDELSRVLDPSAAERLRALLDARCAAGLTALLITHDLDEARRCRRVLAMSGGRIVASGPWAEVCAAALALFGLAAAPSAAPPDEARPLIANERSVS